MSLVKGEGDEVQHTRLESKHNAADGGKRCWNYPIGGNCTTNPFEGDSGTAWIISSFLFNILNFDVFLFASIFLIFEFHAM